VLEGDLQVPVGADGGLRRIEMGRRGRMPCLDLGAGPGERPVESDGSVAVGVLDGNPGELVYGFAQLDQVRRGVLDLGDVLFVRRVGEL